jgi:large subunit ribosomal protein L17
MRVGRKKIKFSRRGDHTKSLIQNLIISLIEHRRIRTTLAKAKAVRPFAERLLTLGKKAYLANLDRVDATKDTPKALHFRRLAIARLRNNVDAVRKLFAELAPASKDRVGGYTRITKLGQRRSDASKMAFIEWVDSPAPLKAPVVDVATEEETDAAVEAEVVEETKPKAKKAAKAKTEAAAEGEEKPKAKKAAKKAAKKKDEE